MSLQIFKNRSLYSFKITNSQGDQAINLACFAFVWRATTFLVFPVEAHSGQLNRVESMFGREEQANFSCWMISNHGVPEMKCLYISRMGRKNLPSVEFSDVANEVLCRGNFFLTLGTSEGGGQGGVKVQFSACVLTDWWWKESKPTADCSSPSELYSSHTQ